MGNTTPSLRANVSWTLAGNVLYAASQWGMLAVLAKLASPEAVGQFSLGLAVAAPVIMFTNLQLREVQATDALDEYSFGDFLGLRLLMTALALVVILALTRIFRHTAETASVIFVVGVAKALEATSDIVYGLLQKHERMDRVAWGMMAKGILSLAALALSVYLTGRVLWGAIALAAAWLAVLVLYDIPSGRLILRQVSGSSVRSGLMHWWGASLRPRWHGKTLARLAWMAAPLGIVMMLISLRANIPRYWVHDSLGEHGLGIYSALAYVQVAGTQVANALGRSASPRLATYYAQGNATAFRRLLLKLVSLACLLGLVGVLLAVVAGREILALLYRPEYAAHAGLFAWVMVAASAIYVGSLLTYGMTAARRLRVQAPLFAIVTGLTALACHWLVPVYGLHGAVMALLASGVAQAGGSLLVIGSSLRSVGLKGDEQSLAAGIGADLTG